MKEALKVARKILTGEVDIVLGSVQLDILLSYNLSEEEYYESDFIIIKGVASEVDDLPIAKEREKWSIEALKTKDKEIESYYRQEVISACQKLVNKYKYAV
jgi:hypothetical protein